jgi:hypothetical protein
MSSSRCGLLSATFHEPGYEHLVELVHQRDADDRRHLASLDVALYATDGALLGTATIDPRLETLDVEELVERTAPGRDRVMVAFDARYDERVFPYRPHHYGYVHRRGTASPPLYYAVNAVLGGVPDRIDNSRLNNFETYVFGSGGAQRYSVMLGNLSRFAPALAEVFTHFDGGARLRQQLALDPRAHAEVPLAAEHEGRRLRRVETKTLFRLATYVVGREASSGTRLLFDHLFTYFK